MSSVSLLSSSAQSNIENFLKELEDPIDLEMMRDPVLLNCQHSLSRVNAEKMYGKMSGMKVDRPGNCPFRCHIPVTSYVANLALNNVIIAFQKNAEVISLAPQHIADEPLPVIPFPGKSAKFYRSNRWTAVKDDKNVALVRQMVLDSGTGGSFVKKITLFGHLNDSVSVLIESPVAKRLADQVDHYYAQLDSGIGTFDRQAKTFLVKSARGLNWAHAFLTENNTFSEECNLLPFVSRLLQEKKWRHIEQEMNALQAPAASPRPVASAPSLPPPYTSSDLPPPYTPSALQLPTAPPLPSSPPPLPLSPVPAFKPMPPSTPKRVAELAKAMEGKLSLTPPLSKAPEQKAPPVYELKRPEQKGAADYKTAPVTKYRSDQVDG